MSIDVGFDPFSPINAHNNRQFQEAEGARNYERQKEFAKMGIQWKVEDARRAGINPLVALGAPTSSYAPNSVGEYSPMGQSTVRASFSTRTEQDKEAAALQLSSAKLDVQGKEIDNAYKLEQLKRLQVGQPSFPSDNGNFIPGQGNSGIKINPSERTMSAPGKPGQDAGWITDRAFARTDTGLVPVPSKDVTERIEDKLIPETMWAVRNMLAPNWNSSDTAPSQSQLPPGYDRWSWSMWKQEWQPRKDPWWTKDRKQYFKRK